MLAAVVWKKAATAFQYLVSRDGLSPHSCDILVFQTFVCDMACTSAGSDKAPSGGTMADPDQPAAANWTLLPDAPSCLCWDWCERSAQFDADPEAGGSDVEGLVRLTTLGGQYSKLTLEGDAKVAVAAWDNGTGQDLPLKIVPKIPQRHDAWKAARKLPPGPPTGSTTFLMSGLADISAADAASILCDNASGCRGQRGARQTLYVTRNWSCAYGSLLTGRLLS